MKTQMILFFLILLILGLTSMYFSLGKSVSNTFSLQSSVNVSNEPSPIFDLNIQFMLSPADFNLLTARRFMLLLGNAVNKFVKKPRAPSGKCDIASLDVLIVVASTKYNRKNNPDIIVGAVKPFGRPSWGQSQDPDFAIVENRYLQQVFQGNGVDSVVVRYIENNPDNLPHYIPHSSAFTDAHPATICYHGHVAHLGWAREMMEALKKTSKEVPLVVRVVIKQKYHANVQSILDHLSLQSELVDYNFDTVPQVLSGCDIGLVPQWINFTETATWGRENSVARWEVKPQCHIGRAMHFMQVGVPIIGEACADMSEVIGANGIGYIVEHPSAWYLHLKNLLTDSSAREVMSAKTLSYCKNTFSLDKEALTLLNFIESKYGEGIRRKRSKSKQ